MYALRNILERLLHSFCLAVKQHYIERCVRYEMCVHFLLFKFYSNNFPLQQTFKELCLR